MRRGVAIAMTTIILLVVVAVAAAGISPIYANASHEALALWQRFPVNAQPRPVIPINAIVSNPNDGPEDVALSGHQLKLQVALPGSPSTAGGYRLIGTNTALSDLRGFESNGPSLLPPAVAIQAVLLGSARFLTDRGWTRLPAWRFYFKGFQQPASVLAARPYPAPPLRRLDPSGINSQAGGSAVLSSGGRRLTISFTGGPAGNEPCDDSYTVTTIASRTAVVFTIIDTPVPVPTGEPCTAVGYRRQVVARLAYPLGARVLVDSTDGGAIPVTLRSTSPF